MHAQKLLRNSRGLVIIPLGSCYFTRYFWLLFSGQSSEGVQMWIQVTMTSLCNLIVTYVAFNPLCMHNTFLSCNLWTSFLHIPLSGLPSFFSFSVQSSHLYIIALLSQMNRFCEYVLSWLQQKRHSSQCVTFVLETVCQACDWARCTSGSFSTFSSALIDFQAVDGLL